MKQYEELDIWKEYQSGIEFKTNIGLYEDVNKNNQFYSGNPWQGVVTNGLPVTSLPLVRQIVNHKVSIISGDDVKINYSIDGIDDTAVDSEELIEVAKQLSAYSMTLWENLQEDSKNEQALLDGALSGDGIEYFSWDKNIDAGNGIKGNICSEIVDNVNYFPANPNNSDVQSQVSITIAFRKMVEDLKKEAKANGITKEEYDKITPDEETENQAGEMAKIELAKSGKCICLLKMWKKDGKVYFNKSTKYARITKGDVDSGLTLYPVAAFNWIKRKNCCHGISEVKGIIPNQMAINKLVSMIILAVMHISIPKMIYDSSRMAAPSNMIGGAIGVTGDPNQVAKYLTPGQLSNDIYKVVDLLIDKTKEMLGATDAALGQLNMDNTSALVVLQKASAIPSKPIIRRYHQFIEDKARIWMDFFIHKYSVSRTLTYTDQGVNRTFNFNGEQYGNLQWRVKVDVGVSAIWSEIQSIQTIDNWLTNGYMSKTQALERYPSGIIPMQEKLMVEWKEEETDRQVMFKLLAKYAESRPDIQEKLRGMKPEEIEQALKEMVLQEPEPQQANQAAAVM
jgi:hypothetical protein